MTRSASPLRAVGCAAGQAHERLFAIRDRVDECYELTRTVRDERWRSIRNFMPHRPRMQLSSYSEPTPTRQELRRLAAEGKLTGAAKDFMSPTKAPEELYDTQADPHEVNSLGAVGSKARPAAEAIRSALAKASRGKGDHATYVCSALAHALAAKRLLYNYTHYIGMA